MSKIKWVANAAGQGIVGWAVIQAGGYLIGLVATLFFALFAYDAGLQWYWLIILTGALLFFFVSAVNGIFTLIDRIRQRKKGTAATQPESNTTPTIKEDSHSGDAKRVEELRSRVEELEREKAELEAFKHQHKWLQESAARDKSNIGKYVYIIFRKIKYEGLDEQLDKYVEIVFDIINASLYHVTIEKEIKDGALYLNDVELNPKQTKIDGSLFNISREDRGDNRLLVIKQWLSDTQAERIRNPLPDDCLYFNRLWLVVRAEHNPEVSPDRLALPNKIPIGTPANKPTAPQTGSLEDNIKKTVESLKAQHQTEIARLQHEIETLNLRLSFRENDLETLKTLYGWLHELADEQAKNIDEYVKLDHISLGDVNLTRDVPSVRFGLYIANYSVFDISIDDEIKGCIRFRGEDLLEKKRVLNPVKDLPPMKIECLTIEQRLSSTEAGLIAKSENATEPNFLFHGLTITIKGGTRFSEVDAKPLIITSSDGVSIKGGPPIYRI